MHGEASAPSIEERSPLAACGACESLLEAQHHDGEDVWPDFCPWCGKHTRPIIGSEVDGYRIDRLIASGGFGFVYLASNIAQPTMLAVVKFLRPAWTYADEEIVSTFLEEARLTQEIGRSCWNVVNVLNVRASPWPHLMMEYIEGTTLDEVIRRAGSERIPLADAKGYLRGVAEALAATHDHQRVHRDLKPLNLMVIESEKVPDSQRKIKLLDFGLAMQTTREPMADGGEEGATAAGTASRLATAGTPEYMAPEAFDGAAGVGLDVHSFGVTAFELLTGRLPWPLPPPLGDRVTYWREIKRDQSPDSLRALRPEIPKWLASVVRDCLDKDPKRRPQSADELIRRLREPVPMWVRATAALIVVALCSLVFWLASTRRVDVPVIWTVDDLTGDEGDLTVWRGREVGLSGHTLSLRVPGNQPMTTLETSDAQVSCELDPNGRSAKLGVVDDLPAGSEVAVSGTGEDFQFRAILRVEEDMVDPVLGEVQIEAPGLERRTLRDGERLQPSVLVGIEVEEAQLARAQLFLQPVGETRETDPVDLREDRSGDPPRIRWTYPLEDVRDGEYLLRIVAIDKALNRVASDPILCVVDGTPSRPLGAARFYARGRVLIPFRLAEAITRLRAQHGGAELPVEIWALEKNKDPLELVRSATFPPALTASELTPDGSYVLAYSPPAEPRDFAVSILLADGATPANQSTVRLPGRWPEPLVARDFLRARFQLGAVARPVARPLVEFDAIKRENQLRTSATRIERASLEVAEGRVTAASYRLGFGETVFLPVNRSTVDLPQGLELEPDTENLLAISLWGGDARPYVVNFRIVSDTRQPVVRTFVSSPPGSDRGDYYAVGSGDGLQLRLEAEEQLEHVTLIQGANEIAMSPKEDESGRTFRFPSLAALDLSDGESSVEIRARDRAGLETTETLRLVLNSRAPVLEPVDELRGDRYRIGSESHNFRFVASDANGIDWSGARCLLSYRLADGREVREMSLVVTVDDEDAVDPQGVVVLELPDGTRGNLQVRVPDRLGLRGSATWDFEVELPAARYRDEFVYKGVPWVFVDLGESRRYYISKFEISNETYGRLASQAEGVSRPRYWNEDGAFPVFVTADGRELEGAGFPVVGVTPRDAESVARVVDRAARLPSWDEWLSIARRDNPGGRYPWRDDQVGRKAVNHFHVGKEGSLAWASQSSVSMRVGARTYRPVRLVPAATNPFPPDHLETTYGRLPHLLGNAGELVRYDGRYAVAGKDFDTFYDSMRLTLGPVQHTREELYHHYRVGMRWIVPIDGAGAAFLAEAREN